jgi:hypothetical protein
MSLETSSHALRDGDIRSIAEIIYERYGKEATLSHRAVEIINEIMTTIGYDSEEIAANRLRVQREVLNIRREQ